MDVAFIKHFVAERSFHFLIFSLKVKNTDCIFNIGHDLLTQEVRKYVLQAHCHRITYIFFSVFGAYLSQYHSLCYAFAFLVGN